MSSAGWMFHNLCVVIFSVVNAHRSFWRDAFLFEYLLVPRCQYASGLTDQTDAYCVNACMQNCSLGYDIKNWRSCLLAMGHKCMFKPILYMSASLSELKSTCINHQNNIVIPDLLHCDDCSNESKYYSYRFSIDKKKTAECLTATYKLIPIKSISPCNHKLFEIELSPTCKNPIYVTDDEGNDMILLLFNRAVKASAFSIVSSIPDCIIQNGKVPKYQFYGYLIDNQNVVGIKNANTAFIDFDKREELYLKN